MKGYFFNVPSEVATMLSFFDFEDWQDKSHEIYIKPLISLGPSVPGLREGFLYIIMI